MQKEAERPQYNRFWKLFFFNEWSVHCGKYKREKFEEVGRGWIRQSFVRHIKRLYFICRVMGTHWRVVSGGIEQSLLHMAVQVVHCKTLRGCIHTDRPLLGCAWWSTMTMQGGASCFFTNITVVVVWRTQVCSRGRGTKLEWPLRWQL